ncbi:MAG TPA: RNA-directed DNA polymerase [Pseudoxanthomonas sp.]
MTDRVRPGVIATKAVNQYRRRDAFAYLGLRQLLKGVVARSDDWANQIAVDQVIRRSTPSYFVSEHFKERDAGGRDVFRKIVVPGPLEILAEVSLLTACAGLRELEPHESVFTYRLSNPSDRSGVYKNYMDGLRARHRAIEMACSSSPNSVVRFLDLKKFYPSIRSKDIKAAWRKHAGGLSAIHKLLGERLIDDHGRNSVDGSRGLLTGPMFSHFMANLVMRDVDEWASKELGVHYFRYVDDIALVGERSGVASATSKLAERLKTLDLTLHDEHSAKTMEVDALTWLDGKSDFEHDFGNLTWGRFISDIKSFLTLNPDKSQRLASALADAGARLPVLDYSIAVKEARHAESFYGRARRAFFRATTAALTVESIADAGRRLRAKMESELQPMLDQLPATTGFARKRLIPKLRFRIGRLAYLSEESVLESFADAASGVEELVLQREVIRATATGDLSQIVAMGANAMQAAAQPLTAGAQNVSLTADALTSVELQAIAVAALNGVTISGKNAVISDDGILDLSRGVRIKELKKSAQSFISEVAFLAGTEGGHGSLLSDAFDEDERLTFDAVERFEESAPRVI